MSVNSTGQPTSQAATAMRERILDAAVETAAIYGIAKLSVRDVADRAGVSRQTLYKHFPSKQDLLVQATWRETDDMVAQIVAASEAEPDVTDALEAAILATLRVAREHPLLDRLVRTEPEQLLPLLTSDGGPIVSSVREVVEEIVIQRLPGVAPLDARRSADLITRLMVSYSINAPDDPPEVVAASLAGMLIGGMPASSARTGKLRAPGAAQQTGGVR